MKPYRSPYRADSHAYNRCEACDNGRWKPSTCAGCVSNRELAERLGLTL